MTDTYIKRANWYAIFPDLPEQVKCGYCGEMSDTNWGETSLDFRELNDEIELHLYHECYPEDYIEEGNEGRYRTTSTYYTVKTSTKIEFTGEIRFEED